MAVGERAERTLPLDHVCLVGGVTESYMSAMESTALDEQRSTQKDLCDFVLCSHFGCIGIEPNNPKNPTAMWI